MSHYSDTCGAVMHIRDCLIRDLCVYWRCMHTLAYSWSGDRSEMGVTRKTFFKETVRSNPYKNATS